MHPTKWKRSNQAAKIIYSIDEFAEKYGMIGGLVQKPVMAILIVPKTELLIGHLGPMFLLCLLVQPNTAQESTEKYITLR